jgi:hypothetical protein
MNAKIFVDPDTTADITLTSAGSSQSQAISSSDQIRIQANASGGSCSSASVDSTSTTAGAVTLVQDGTPLSAIASSSSAQTNLTNLLGSSYVQNGTIKLSENQVLYLLETNTADSDFPADDAIVLVTINP